MKLELYCVFDRAVGAYLQPLFMRSRGEAIRSFSDACLDVKHQFSAHAKDYELFFFGSWDDSNGRFECELEPHRVCGGGDFVAPAEG